MSKKKQKGEKGGKGGRETKYRYRHDKLVTGRSGLWNFDPLRRRKQAPGHTSPGRVKEPHEKEPAYFAWYPSNRRAACAVICPVRQTETPAFIPVMGIVVRTCDMSLDMSLSTHGTHACRVSVHQSPTLRSVWQRWWHFDKRGSVGGVEIGLGSILCRQP